MVLVKKQNLLNRKALEKIVQSNKSKVNEADHFVPYDIIDVLGQLTSFFSNYNLVNLKLLLKSKGYVQIKQYEI